MAKKASRNNAGLTIYDAVHGVIDVRDYWSRSAAQPILAPLLATPMVDRLRRIKQLGFASHGYPAADHSRYAHALGTMHMMRQLCERLNTQAPEIFTKALRHIRPFGAPRISGVEQLKQHLLVAALLQDVGETPYNQSTAAILRPHDNIRKKIEQELDCDTTDWPHKSLFTIGSLLKDESLSQHQLNVRFLAYLIAGCVPKDGDSPPALLALRHMLDGEVDADRLDYVFRDAHHTIEGRATARRVVDSLLRYDERGPVFCDPGPVSDFLALRASLWSSVYFSPENRFRIVLLATVMKGVLEHPSAAETLFGSADGVLTFEDFQKLDDVSLNSRLRDLTRAKLAEQFDERVRNALHVVVGSSADYECFWITASDDKKAKKQNIPADVYFDTFNDYQTNHSAYEEGAIRVSGGRFRYLSKEINLEDCCGAFSEVFKRPWNALEQPGSILLFCRKKHDVTSIKQTLTFDQIAMFDPLSAVDLPADTRRKNGFDGPSIFVSYCVDDVAVVNKLVHALYWKRRRYYLLLKRFQGVGGTPGDNSIKCVNEADAVIILASTNYVTRYTAQPNGNIAKELLTMGQRGKAGGLPIVCLSADPHKEIQNFPHIAIGYNAPPFVGTKALRDADRNTIREAVQEALDAIAAAIAPPSAATKKSAKRLPPKK
jgi:HD superfamily phosphohydrolase